MYLFLKQLAKRINPYIQNLQLEERAVITNWLLLAVSLAISFCVITGGIAPLICIAAAPVIGWLAPTIISFLGRHTPLQYYLTNNQIGSRVTLIADTRISEKKDDIWSAITKFILHTLMHLYVLYNSTLIIVSSLNLAPIALVGCSCILVTAIILIPMMLKECINLISVAQKTNTTRTSITDTHQTTILVQQFILGIIAASGVFVGMYFLGKWALAATILPLSFIAFCPPLLAFTTLFLIGYGMYIYHNKELLDEFSTTDMLKKIISFLTLSIGASWVIFKLSCGVGVLEVGHLASIGLLGAIATTSLTLGFPILIILTCATVICLTHTFKGDGPDGKPLLKEQEVNNEYDTDFDHKLASTVDATTAMELIQREGDHQNTQLLQEREEATCDNPKNKVLTK